MRALLHRAAIAAAIVAMASTARADGFSTSAINPTPIAATGLVTGNYPAGETETSYYLAVDLKAGELATQMSLVGRAGRDKSLALDLKDPKVKLVGYYSVMAGIDANQEATRVFPIDSSGRYLVILKLNGPETTSFRLELGGSAFTQRQAVAPAASGLSNSYLAPTPLPKDGVVAGTFPGGERQKTYYYVAVDLKPGDLLTQLSFAGRANAPKMLELELLDGKGRVGPNSGTYIMGELDAKAEKIRTFAVDSAGRYVMRIAVSGAEGTSFKVELGGSAYRVMN